MDDGSGIIDVGAGCAPRWSPSRIHSFAEGIWHELNDSLGLRGNLNADEALRAAGYGAAAPGPRSSSVAIFAAQREAEMTRAWKFVCRLTMGADLFGYIFAGTLPDMVRLSPALLAYSTLRAGFVAENFVPVSPCRESGA